MFTNFRFLALMRHSLKLVLFRAFFLLLLLISCSQQNIVEEHFKNHGMSYPLDTSGMIVWNVEYVGIEESELLAPGAREYIESGIMFAKEYFQSQNIQTFIPGTMAIVLSKPVLFRDDSGEVGLMVKVTAYGAGKPNSEIKLPIGWLGADKQLWRVENFAYFSRSDYHKWECNGWVYPTPFYPAP